MRTERELREGRDLPVTEGPWRWWHGGAGSAVVGAEAAGSGAGGQEGLGEKKPGPRAQYPMEMGLRVTGSGGDGAEGTWIQQRTTSTVPGWEEEAGTACTTMVAGGGEEAVACFGLVGGEARRRWGSGLVAQGETRKLEGEERRRTGESHGEEIEKDRERIESWRKKLVWASRSDACALHQSGSFGVGQSIPCMCAPPIEGKHPDRVLVWHRKNIHPHVSSGGFYSKTSIRSV